MPKSALSIHNHISAEKVMSHSSEKRLVQNAQISTKSKGKLISDPLLEVASTRSKTKEAGKKTAGQKVPTSMKKTQMPSNAPRDSAKSSNPLTPRFVQINLKMFNNFVGGDSSRQSAG